MIPRTQTAACRRNAVRTSVTTREPLKSPPTVRIDACHLSGEIHQRLVAVPRDHTFDIGRGAAVSVLLQRERGAIDIRPPASFSRQQPLLVKALHDREHRRVRTHTPAGAVERIHRLSHGACACDPHVVHDDLLEFVQFGRIRDIVGHRRSVAGRLSYYVW